jgi:biotin-(acetyl-CoA carboxylase) ligase
MPAEIRAKSRLGNELSLPPGFRLVTLREVGDAFAHAKTHASQLGAGTLVFVGRFDLAEFAVVLEPEEPLSAARRAFYIGMCALADTLAAHAPPEKPVEFVWPDGIRIDGGSVGGGLLAWADGPEHRAAEWLVFGAMIRTVSIAEGDPGLRPLESALEEEGFDGLGSAELAESFARHLMTAVDRWQEHGFDAIAKDYLSRLVPEKGVSRSIADNGDLLVRRIGKADLERKPLIPALAHPSWLDPASRGPR